MDTVLGRALARVHQVVALLLGGICEVYAKLQEMCVASWMVSRGTSIRHILLYVICTVCHMCGGIVPALFFFWRGVVPINNTL